MSAESRADLTKPDLIKPTPAKEVVNTNKVQKKHVNVTSTLLTKPDKYKNLLLALTPNGKCVGIKLDYGKPESFESETEKEAWLENAAKKALALRDTIENGTVQIDNIKDMLDLNPCAPIHQIERMKQEKNIGLK